MHGFRTIASTHLRELGFDNDLVELQLAHKISNPVRAAYDRAARIPERVAMMQAYADHLESLKGGKVIDFTRRRGVRG
jgi:integrase